MEESGILHFLSQYGLYGGTFITCVISGFIPVVNAEIYLLLISTLTGKSQYLPILLLATSGQMTAKMTLFLAGKGILKLSLKKYEHKINNALVKLQKWDSKSDILILISAFTGFPPFYLITIAAGMIQHNFLRFILFGFSGRLLRFAIVLYFPQFFQHYFR
jgi:membrane protein YqaA with SNARE-associated domain